MARLKAPKCEHCQQTIRAKREPKEKPLPAVVNAEWLSLGASPGERWGRYLASFRPGGIEAWENARKISHEVLMEARELFGPYATFGNGSKIHWVGALTATKGSESIGWGASLQEALADAKAKVEAGVVVIEPVEWVTADLHFGGASVEWPRGRPAMVVPVEPEEQEATDKQDSWHIRRWAAQHINTTCLTADEGFRVLDRFMADRQDLDESEVMEEPEELEPAEAFAREHEDDETPEEEPGEEATPEEEAPVIPDEDMETFGAADLDDAERELVAA